MSRRIIVGVGLALVAAVAIPFGLPRTVAASTSSYSLLAFSPNPIAQPGTLALSGQIDICVQPESSLGVHVQSAQQVWLSIDSGKFTEPPSAGGTASVNGVPLTSTPQMFTTSSATCTFTGSTATTKFAIPVVYTAPASAHTNGRDVITAADDSADSGSAGVCPTLTAGVVCNTDTYVFSPVASYVFSPSPIAATGTLTAGQQVPVTVTALDDSTPTPQPVPGAYLDLSLLSSGSGGSATAVNNISVPPSTRNLTNTPERVGANSAGQVAITYTAANPATASGTDTIKAQDHPTITVMATTTYEYSATTTAPSNPYTAVAPFRICDTRPVGPGIASNQCNTGVGSGPLGSNSTRVITDSVSGNGVPATGVTAVVVNVTAIAPSQNTFLTLYPDGSAKPATSNLNPRTSEVVANLVEVGVSSAGKLDLYNDLGTINVAMDIEGYVSATIAANTGFFQAAPSGPVRICDTRAAGPGISANRCNTGGASPIAGGATLTFNVNGAPSPVPGTAVTAVVFNLTAIGASQRTVLTAFAGGTARPIASNVNVEANETVPNRVIVPVTCSGGNCTVSIWNSVGSVNIAVDLNGWFITTSGPSTFTALSAPARVCDTQDGNLNDQGCTKALVGPTANLNIAVTNIDAIPSTATAIVANVTAVNATATTYVTVYPGLTSRPTASDLNVTSFWPVPNLVVVGVGSDGTINLFNAAGNVNLIVDVLGYYS
jgi:hypothetical protein